MPRDSFTIIHRNEGRRIQETHSHQLYGWVTPLTGERRDAKRANVANATLYRNFSTREQLILAVYKAEVRQLVDVAGELLAERVPGEALEMWVARLAEYAMTKQGPAGALQAATSPVTESFLTSTTQS
jgi:AcrR family transcriptional regulator